MIVFLDVDKSRPSFLAMASSTSSCGRPGRVCGEEVAGHRHSGQPGAAFLLTAPPIRIRGAGRWIGRGEQIVSPTGSGALMGPSSRSTSVADLEGLLQPSSARRAAGRHPRVRGAHARTGRTDASCALPSRGRRGWPRLGQEAGVTERHARHQQPEGDALRYVPPRTEGRVALEHRVRLPGRTVPSGTSGP